MACAIEFKPDFLEFRVNNGGKNYAGDATWTNAIGAVLNAATSTTKGNFIAATGTVTESGYAGTDTLATVEYARLGSYLADRKMEIVVANTIEDGLGYKPAINFDLGFELNIYAPPTAKHDGSAISGYSFDEMYNDLATLISGCNNYDILMIDSKAGDASGYAVIIGDLSGKCEINIMESPARVKLTFDRNIRDKSNVFDIIKLTS